MSMEMFSTATAKERLPFFPVGTAPAVPKKTSLIFHFLFFKKGSAREKITSPINSIAIGFVKKTK